MLTGRRAKRLLPIVCAIAFAVIHTGCVEWAALITTAVQSFQEYKALHEAFVNDIKREYQPTDAAYVEAQRDYLAVTTRYDSYLQAVAIALATHDRDANLGQLATAVEAASAQFLRSSARSMRPNMDPREFPVDSRSKLPAALHVDLSKLPGQVREHALQVIREKAQLRAWDDI